MTIRMNQYHQPIGLALPDWRGAALPEGRPLAGQYCRLERVDVERHAAELYEAYADAPDGRDWTYLFAGPFDSFDSYRTYLEGVASLRDPMHYAIIDSGSGRAVGTLALMRIDASNGVMEVGSVTYSPRLKRTRAATEAIALLMQYAFQTLGYRRFEWKCDALNAPSRSAALRYGFTFEGIFRQAIVTRQRNRDTAWYSIIDSEYPSIGAAHERWLNAANFDEEGKQIETLAHLIAREKSDCEHREGQE